MHGFYYLFCYLFIIRMRFENRGAVSLKLLLLFQLLSVSVIAAGHSCYTAMASNWLTGYAWSRCYQASDGTVIGYSQGSLSGGDWLGRSSYASWDYDYNNNIAFYQPGHVITQTWNYRYHSFDTCADYSYTSGYNCYCSRGYSCYSSWWDTCCDWDSCWSCWPRLFARQWNYYNDDAVATNLYLPCHPLCSSCTASWSNTTCQSCWDRNGRAYRWLAWGSSSSYINTCHTSCPNDWQNGYSNQYPGQYITSASTYNSLCAQCNTTCSVCADYNGGQVCSVCVSNAALIQNYDKCIQDFPYDSGYCRGDNQCVFTSCPTNLYFWLWRNQTANASYIFTATGASNLRLTNICYLCHKYCLTCTDQYDYKCTSCAGSYYLWQQYTTRCNYFCNEGVYTSGGTKGQYVISLSTRTCGTCDPGCKFCATSSSKCYICQDSHFLVDDQDTCTTTFNCPLCLNTTLVTDGCANRDNICRPSNCPAFFYFRVNRTSTGNIHDDPMNKLYYHFTTSSVFVDTAVNGYELNTARSDNSTYKSPQGRNTTYYYRQQTNLCVLCDFRCMVCFGPTNMNCTMCRNNYYKWTNATVCSSLCPTGQFQQNISTSYPANETMCANCDVRCVACVGWNNNCTKCVSFPLANYAFLFTYFLQNSTCMNSCPTSPNSLTSKGYYGSIATMICYPCPGQCSDCNINLVMDTVNFPELQPLVCGNDYLCSKGIRCTACLQGYSLVAGQCVDQTTCRLYSYYKKSAGSSSSWTPSNCACVDGYYMSSTPLTCAPCHISCLTCNGSSSSSCLSCPVGYALVGYTCSSSNAGSQVYTNYNWASSSGFNSYISTTYNAKFNCGTYQTLFGYKSLQTKSSKFIYNTQALPNKNYYGISFRLRILFIENWDNTASIFFKLGSNTNPSFIYNYNNFGAIGEMQCGTTTNEYLLTVAGQIETIPTATNQAYTINVYSNVDPISNATGYYYYWGVESAFFTVLACHPDCSSCTGPLATQCTSCSDSAKILKDGKCICDVSRNYYYVLNSNTNCQIGCNLCNSSTSPNSCYYRDALTATCVNPPLLNCSAPNLYGDNYQIVNFYGTCVQTCGSGMYAVPSLMKCTSNCPAFGLFYYQGATGVGTAMWTCVSACPSGLILDYTTVSCVTICPYYASNTTRYFFQMENRTTDPKCVINCTTGYEFDPLNQCVMSCPAGYYTQTVSNHNKCVQKCATNTYGDNVTLTCVAICPSPSIADPSTNICVNECPLSYYFQINAQFGNRTCVTQCQTAQWLHPYFLNCSRNPMDCPVGTYADNSTKKCEFTCKVFGQVGENTTRMCQTSCNTGYAYWDGGICVFQCNRTMYGFIDNTRRECVANCNANSTSTYADLQGNRNCIKNCTATPDATFGDSISSTCVKQCPSGWYADPFNPYRLCVRVCTNFPDQTFAYELTQLCVANCPVGFYGDNYTTSGVGICGTTCPSGYYGDPIANLCVVKCPFRYYGSPINGRPCLQVCSNGYYAINLTTNRVCTSVCDQGYWADNYTRFCYNVKTSCRNKTYADALRRLCVVGTSCTAGTYADPFTMGCESRCSNSTYFGDPSTNLCVMLCPTTPDYYSQAGYCTATCSGGFFADYQANRTCLAKCTVSPLPLYGTGLFRCVAAKLCGTGLFGNNNTQLCSTCSGTLPFGDPITFQCVYNCSLTYYGSTRTNLCVINCNFSFFEYADNATQQCTTLCSLGTYGVNSSSSPVCLRSCTANSYALDTNRVCMANCGTGFFGDAITGKCYNSSMNCSAGYFGNTVTNMCVLPQYCQTVAGLHYYADDATKMCISKCTTPNYGLNDTWYCIPKCPNPYYAQNNTRMCLLLSGCGIYFSFADTQINICVSQCSTDPVFTYSENITYTCVTPVNCPSTMLAENITQSCVYHCPHNSTYYSYADPFKSDRCVSKCPEKYYGQISSGRGLCASVCPGLNYFRDNTTQLCVYVCPAGNSSLGTVDTFGDNTTDVCVTRCPPGYFAQVQVNRTCVQVCMAGTWGNPQTRTCITNPVTSCPTGMWADNFTNLCTSFCSSNSSNSQLFYGQNTTRLCVPSCPVPTFAFMESRVCIDICPVTIANTPGYFGDPGTTPTRLCVTTCMTTGLFRDVANNRTCQPTCTYNATYKTYQNPTLMTCTSQCPTFPQYLYAWASNSTNAACLPSCPTGFMNQANMSCVATCPYLLQPTANRCLSACPFNAATNSTLYANLLTSRCVTPDLCPIDTYASDDSLTCVTQCPNNTYIFVKNCVRFCPNGYYINSVTQTCVLPSACPPNHYANNQTTSCVSACTNGTFGDTNTRQCITACYGTNYADPLTGLCSSSCTTGLIKNAATLTCVSSCTMGTFYNILNSSCTATCQSPYFADTKSQACVLVCPSSPMTFASISPVRACVSTCPSSAPWFDLINRVCSASCPGNTYQYSVNASCVSFCPFPYFLLSSVCVLNCSSNGTLNMYSDGTTQTCVNTCPNGYYSDPTTYKCVLVCPINPVRHYADSSKKCLSTCPSTKYADNQKGACVAQCSVAPLTYADQSTGKCVLSCPVSNATFADPISQKCVSRCPSGYFADNRQRMCLANCSNIFYADTQTNPPACVSTCTLGYFADPLLFKCVTTCSATYFAYQPNSTCVQFCPFGYFANPTSKYCVTQCVISTNLYADNLTRTCSASCSNGQFTFKPQGRSYGICVFNCPNTYFADARTMSCVFPCPSNTFGSTINNTCNQDCQQSQFKDSLNRLCQNVCPELDSLFGEPYSRTCVTTCNSTGYSEMYADSTNRMCSPTCSGSQYADPVTLRCVTVTACSTGLNADPFLKRCVSRCYNLTYAYDKICYLTCPTNTSTALFADEQSQSCVVATSCASGLFADATKGKCVSFCDIASGRFADAGSKMCVTNCLAPLYANNITRTCTSTCPSVPLYYGVNTTRICAPNCPPNTFGDPTLNFCVQKCADGLYGDSIRWSCVQECPAGTFGDNSTNLCVTKCPTDPPYFGDMFTRTCVLHCSNKLYADAANNRECQETCLSPTYSENSTMQCVTFCLTGYADRRTGRCISNCTRGYYGFNFICHQNQCPSTTPQLYADDITNLCVDQCPLGFYGQYNSRKCVRICPLSPELYANTADRTCIPTCPFGTFADPISRICVGICPAVPSLFGINSICAVNCTGGLFADNSSRSCVLNCPNGTFADSSTWTCVTVCPTKPMAFADQLTNTCVPRCLLPLDYYADNATRSCTKNCSNNTFADPVSKTCKPVCPTGYFGVNSTLRCERTCPSPSFADKFINLCVARCSIDPIFYGDTSNNNCVPLCPANSFGNPLNQECTATNSTCPDGYFANPRNQLCTQVCPMRFDLYAEPTSKTCKASCVSPYFADNSTMRCVLVCPPYPNYYANLVTGRCVKYCPINTYADNSSRICVRTCPNGTYAENSTWRCVITCPNRPVTLRDPLNWKCVSQCPPSLFSDYLNLLCVPNCTADIAGFARNDTRECVKVCPINTFAYLPTRTCVANCYNGTFADSSSRTCVTRCPRSPALFAVSVLMVCVSQCPQGMFAFEDTRQCVFNCPVLGFYRQNSSRLCVRSCNVSEGSYTDNLTGYCVERCSVGTFADPTTRRCVSICPNQPLMYAENSTQSCVSLCPTNLYGQNKTRTCVSNCPNGSLSLQENRLCVFVCPVGFYAYIPTQFCEQLCPSPFYGDPSTRTCVAACPINQLLYADNQTRTCVAKCPSGSYAYQWSVACLPSCPVARPPFVQTYAASYDNTCTEQCAFPFYSYDATFKCVSSCPDPYFNNLESHECDSCPSTCSSCTGLTRCKTCFAGYFLQNGACIQNCTLLYYANSATKSCVLSPSCRPSFGQNSTRTCILSCAIGSFANTAVFRCDACPSTCVSCTSLRNCLTCVTASLLFNNFCYGYCNMNSATISYFDKDNTTCTSTCPSGTYASVVFCKLCSSVCATCSVTPTNCTSCSSGYLLSGGCVSACPTSFKPNAGRVCVACNDTCGSGLTVSSNVTNTGGQTSVFMSFNSAVSFTGNLYSTFSITSSGRRLLQSGNVGYQIIVIDPQTIQIVFPPGSTNTNINVEIANPQNIVDAYGNLPASLVTQLQVDANSLYSKSINQAPNDFPLYFTFLGIICVISFVFDLELMKFLQIVYVHYFISVNLPPEMIKVFMGIKYSTLHYLPRMFSVDSPVLRPSIPSSIYNSIGDYNFLRNAGFAFTPLLIILILWGILKLLSVPEVNHFKKARVFCQNLLQEKFKYAVIMEWVAMFMVNTVFFAFLQLRDYSIYDEFTQVSLILAHAFILFFAIVFVLLLYRILSFHQEHPVLSSSLKKAADIILQDDQADNLVSTNIFLSQKKKIDLRNLYYPKINNENIFPFKCIYRYNIFSLLCPNVNILRAILLSAFIALPKADPLMQISLCLPLNFLTLLYFCKARPYTFKFRRYRIKSYIAIYHEACLIILELLLLVLIIKDRKKASSAEKEDFCQNIIYYLTAVCSISFIYHIFALVVHLYRKVWLVLIQSQIFRRNFPAKYAEYQAAKNKGKQLVKSIDPKAKEALKSMIQGYKKTKSILRPTDHEKANSQLPIKYKLKYLQPSQTSSFNSKSTLSKSQKKKMLREIFDPEQRFSLPKEQDGEKYEVINGKNEGKEFEYEQYEEEIEIKAKDLSQYVANPSALLKEKIEVQNL